ncbi:ankyrin repeat domain-containing protein SOWAHA-like isoform X2 [Leptopilina boulardi]|uniref:ankyrin repeat domain-containing protein SOWAHA-like isoform X2 n=1 Tax=Leptopilina boulardi TaxID=63433 RepID=UPI0021F60C38|nr:ankyrin repeat domain-containing protein SOWAHA-like isoform X2 [Leptopilina boulardi]
MTNAQSRRRSPIGGDCSLRVSWPSRTLPPGGEIPSPPPPPPPPPIRTWVTDSIAKELPLAFGTGSPFSYGFQQMLHLQHIQQFQHFQPFSAFKPPPGPSAFAPPGKCLKVETGSSTVSSGLPSISSLSSISNMFSPSLPTSVAGGPGGPELAPQSPAGSTSRSPPGSATSTIVGSIAPSRGTPPEEEDRDANATPGSENTERSTPEEGRPYRLGPVFGGRCGAEALGLGLPLGPAYRFALPPVLAVKTSRNLAFDQDQK